MNEQGKKSIAKTILKYIFKTCCILGGGKNKGAIIFLGSLIVSIIYFIYNTVQNDGNIGPSFESSYPLFFILWIGGVLLRFFPAEGVSKSIEETSKSMGLDPYKKIR